MSKYLPKEIIIEILLKLPVKSLIRFTTVCKSWHTIISNSKFIFSHISNGESKEDNTLILRRYMEDKAEHYTLLKDVEDQTLGLQSFLALDFPFKSPIGHFRIVGTAKGLVCLYQEFFADPPHSIILWNPCVRKHIVLTPTINSGTFDSVVLGFGATSCDIKIVRLVYHKTNDFACKVPAEVEIYSLNSGTWRRVHFNDSYIIKEFMWSQAFIEGSVHWIAFNSLKDSHRSNSFFSFIASLHMDDEISGKILLPDDLALVCARYLSITVVGGSLGVIKNDDSGSWCVWMMKEYGVMKSWTKLYNIDSVGGIEFVIGFRKNGEVLLASQRNELVTYNPETMLSKGMGISGEASSFYINKYTESLVLLTGQNVVADKLLLPPGKSSHTSRRQKHGRSNDVLESKATKGKRKM